MGRILEFIFLFFLLWLAFEGLKARIRAFFSGGTPVAPPRPPRSSAETAGRPGETLVRCSECGAHVPESRALPARDGRAALYCSVRCRETGAAEKGRRARS
ncbi:MAG TPA: hypothetical protein VMM92_04860 [Thermoanaerobaculia bacterium]|nr:hypothetical protein [Thermoanaerobaculia bacterium]